MTSEVDSAWQSALAAEHQAVFGYSLLGPRLPAADQRLAVTFSNAHESLRDATAETLVAAGLTPVPPAADYPSLYPVGDTSVARALAIRLEDACAAAWRYLYLQAASSTGRRAHSARGAAQDALTASAVRSAQWAVIVTPQHPTVPFPGT
jgi:hypothetical protein